MDESFIKDQIELIQNMGLNELREKFHDLFNIDPGRTNVANMRNRIATKIQEVCLGGVSSEDMAVLNLIAASDPLAKLIRVPRGQVSKKAGTEYIKVWHGQRYVVKVLGDKKFEYNGEKYKSLTAVAKAITGSHWNGRKFFGVA